MDRVDEQRRSVAPSKAQDPGFRSLVSETFKQNKRKPHKAPPPSKENEKSMRFCSVLRRPMQVRPW